MASLESQSHFQQNRPEIFQADVLHVSRGFDDDKNLARGMVYRRWIFPSKSDLDPCDGRASRLHRVGMIRSWVIFDRVAGQVNLYVSDPDKNSLYSAVVHRLILQR